MGRPDGHRTQGPGGGTCRNRSVFATGHPLCRSGGRRVGRHIRRVLLGRSPGRVGRSALCGLGRRYGGRVGMDPRYRLYPFGTPSGGGDGLPLPGGQSARCRGLRRGADGPLYRDCFPVPGKVPRRGLHHGVGCCSGGLGRWNSGTGHGGNPGIGHHRGRGRDSSRVVLLLPLGRPLGRVLAQHTGNGCGALQPSGTGIGEGGWFCLPLGRFDMAQRHPSGAGRLAGSSDRRSG